jgi:hypothetical protein
VKLLIGQSYSLQVALQVAWGEELGKSKASVKDRRIVRNPTSTNSLGTTVKINMDLGVRDRESIVLALVVTQLFRTP